MTSNRLGRWHRRPVQPTHFRSRTISGLRAPYLRFPEVSGLGDDAFIALVDDPSGATTWLQPGTVRDGRQSILVETPSGPFHVEAVVASGAGQPLTFPIHARSGDCRPGWRRFFGAVTGLLTAGCALWLGAVFWRRLGLHELGKRPATVPPDRELAADYADPRRLKKELESNRTCS